MEQSKLVLKVCLTVTLLSHFLLNIQVRSDKKSLFPPIIARFVTVEFTKVLTDSGDNSGGKNNSIWPVPVVEGLAASYSDPLACSIRHRLRTKKKHNWVHRLEFNLKREINGGRTNGFYQLAVIKKEEKRRQEVCLCVSSMSSTTSFLWYVDGISSGTGELKWYSGTLENHRRHVGFIVPTTAYIGRETGRSKQLFHNTMKMHGLKAY